MFTGERKEGGRTEESKKGGRQYIHWYIDEGSGRGRGGLQMQHTEGHSKDDENRLEL